MLRCLCCDTVWAPPRFGGSAPCVPRLAWLKQPPACSSGKCVCLPPNFRGEAWLHCRACCRPLAGDLQRAAGSIAASEAADSSSCTDDLPHKPELHGSFTLTNSEPQFCRKGKAKFQPLETQKIQMFVKEGELLRGLRVGQFEVLNTVLPFSEEYFATCGSRPLRLNNTAMDEGLTPGCTIHVLRRLRRAPAQEVMELDLFPGNGTARCAVLIDVGLPVPVGIGVLNSVVLFSIRMPVVPQHRSLCWSLVVFPFPRIVVVFLLSVVHPLSLGWC